MTIKAGSGLCQRHLVLVLWSLRMVSYIEDSSIYKGPKERPSYLLVDLSRTVAGIPLNRNEDLAEKLCKMAKLSVILALFVFANVNCVLGENEDIYFAGFFPMNDKIGQGVLPAVKLAIEHINNSSKVFKGKTMHMLFNNTEVCNIFAYIIIAATARKLES